MNRMMFTDDMLEQASDWFERRNELSEAEQAEYQTWLQADGRHQAAASYVQKYFGDNESLVDAALLASKRKQQDSRRSQPAPELAVYRWWHSLQNWLLQPAGLALATILLVAPLVWLTVTPAPQPMVLTEQFATVIGQSRQLQLQDGSEVTMNGNTRMTVELGAERRVELGRGEAFFSVARDPERPFVITTDLGQVRVLGTAFNVDRSGTAMVVSVEHGVVEVSGEATSNGQVYKLYAGDGLRIEGDQITTFQATDAGDWRSGWRKVEAEPLAELVAHLQAHTEKKIEFGDVDRQLSFSGRYRQNDVEGTLTLVADLFDLRIESDDQRIVLKATR